MDVQHVASKIFNVFALKVNSDLSPEQQQVKILEVLSDFKKEVEMATKEKFKKNVLKEVEKTLSSL